MDTSHWETRLAALERSNRIYRNCLLTAGALILAGAGPWQVPEKVQAKAFELVDAKGTVLASMTNFEGNGSITTFNADGKMLTDVVATKGGGGGIVTYDGAGHQNLKITDVKGGGGSIVLNGASGSPVLSLGHNNVGAGSVTWLNKDAKSTALVTSDTAGAGVLLTYDSAGNQASRFPTGSQ